jgi:hypothetical protein
MLESLYLDPEIRVVSQLSPRNNESGNQLTNPFPIEIEIEVAAEVASLAHRKPMWQVAVSRVCPITADGR